MRPSLVALRAALRMEAEALNVERERASFAGDNARKSQLRILRTNIFDVIEDINTLEKMEMTND